MEVIKGYGAPTIETIGAVNDFYVDLDTNEAYRCVSVETIGEEWGGVTLYASELGNTVYMWERAGGSSGADVFHVTITTTGGGGGVTTTGITCDKTYAEIVAARDAGAVIVCTMNLSGGVGCIKTGTVHFDSDYSVSFVGTASSMSMGQLNSYMYTHIVMVDRGDAYQWRYYKVTSAS